MATSSAMATYQIDVPAAGGISDAFVRFLATPGVAETANYLPPIADDFRIDLVTFTNEYMIEIGESAGDPQDLTRGFVQIRVISELGTPQDEVELQPSFTNRVIYADDTGRPGPAVFNRTTSSGLAWATNVPLGDHAIAVSRNGQPLGQLAFTNIGGMGSQITTTSITVIVPGQP